MRRYTSLTLGGLGLGGAASIALCRWLAARKRPLTQTRSASSSPPSPASPAAREEGGAKPSSLGDIEALHVAALAKGEETYIDPATGYTVFTALAHNRRGYCCGSGCRHCPYGHTNVGKPENIRRDRLEAKERKKEGRTQKASVYTRGGDKGTSALFSGERRPKDDLVFDVLGAVDELNSAVGVAMEFCIDAGNGLERHLEVVQGRLMDVGSFVATPRASSPEDRVAYTAFEYAEVEALERLIDDLNAQMPLCRAFILPTGGKAASHLHLARCVCRRAERNLVRYYKEEPGLPVAKYVNRLSDLLFVMARFAAQHDGREDVWRPDRGLPKPKPTV